MRSISASAASIFILEPGSVAHMDTVESERRPENNQNLNLNQCQAKGRQQRRPFLGMGICLAP